MFKQSILKPTYQLTTDQLTKHQLTTNEKPFLLYYSGPREDRILLFSTERNLRLMENCKHWYAYGTFSTSPSPFTQIYVYGKCFNYFLIHFFVI